jgi:hypothetical protein
MTLHAAQIIELRHRKRDVRCSMTSVRHLLARKGTEIWSIGPENTVFGAI